jgi:ABC-type amino acid transport substrate-binding protein
MKTLINKILQLPKKGLFFGLGLLVVFIFIFRACLGPLVESKVYYIVRSNNLAPLELFGKEPNMSAFIDELMGIISEKEHFKIHLSVSNILSGKELFKLLDMNQYDAILVTFSPGDYLKNKYLISEPIYNAGPVLIVNADSNIKSLKDLNGRAVAIKRGSSQIFQFGGKTAFFVSYDNMITALDDLEKNIIGGVIMDGELAQIYANGFYKGKIKIATPPLTDLALRLVAKKGDAEEMLIQKFNAGLQAAEKNGSFEDLIHKWNLLNP